MNSRITEAWKSWLEPSDREMLGVGFRLLKSSYGKKNVVSGKGGDFFVYAKGSIPMCLVAHVDTVRRPGSSLSLCYKDGVLWNADGILGADDRAGVAAIFSILRNSGFRPSVLLTNYEESGSVGVLEWMESATWSGRDTLFIGLDRRGAGQYVFYSHDLPSPVKDYVEGFGFCQHHGTYSDVGVITDHLSVPSVNLSVGFLREHSTEEKLFLDAWELTVKRLSKMLAQPLETLYRIPPHRVHGRNRFGFFDNRPSMEKGLVWDADFDECPMSGVPAIEQCEECPWLRVHGGGSFYECDIVGCFTADELDAYRREGRRDVLC